VTRIDDGIDQGAATGPQRLTAPEILAAVITNKQLKIIAEFHDKADG
jgi:hypothetical protein